MKRSAFLTMLLLTVPLSVSLTAVGPAAANSCGATLAHDPATFTPGHETTTNRQPLLRVKFNDASPHCGIASASMTLDNLDAPDSPAAVPASSYLQGDAYVVEYQVTSTLAISHWQVVASITESNGGPGAVVAWNFYTASCSTSLSHDPSSFTPAHESVVGSTPFVRVDFLDSSGGGQCGITSHSLTLDDLNVQDVPRTLASSASQSGTRYAIQHQIATALAPSHYQLVATLHVGGTSATVAWNFHVASTSCGSYTTHDPASLVPVHETTVYTRLPSVSVRFNDASPQCGLNHASMTLDDLNSAATPPQFGTIQTSTYSGGYQLQATPSSNLADGYYQVVATVIEQGGTTNTVAWNFHVCATDADLDGLGACQETTQGTSDLDQDSDDDSLSDHVESVWHPNRDTWFCGPEECSYPSPRRKDIYVEMDFMGADHVPAVADLQRIVNVFATSPHAANPDGSEGITIHLDAGAAHSNTQWDLGGGNTITHDANLGASEANCANYDWTEFQGLKDAHFQAARQPVYHYMIWAHNLGVNCGSTSGYSRGIPASDFVVTLGSWAGHGTADQRVGTFIHELGHNLGLMHGGNVGNVNNKPNFLSVMNYLFQLDGVPRTAGGAYFGYSHTALNALSEATLDERTGLGADADTWGTRWKCGGVTHFTADADGPIDWNCGGTIESSVRADVNGDNDCGTPPAACDVHSGHRDWGNLAFDGGNVGVPEQIALAAGLSLPPLPLLTRMLNEMTYEMFLANGGEEEPEDHQH